VFAGIDNLGPSLSEPSVTGLSGSSSGRNLIDFGSGNDDNDNLPQGREQIDKTAEEERDAFVIGKILAVGSTTSILSDLNQEVMARARALTQSRSDLSNLAQTLGIF